MDLVGRGESDVWVTYWTVEKSVFRKDVEPLKHGEGVTSRTLICTAGYTCSFRLRWCSHFKCYGTKVGSSVLEASPYLGFVMCRQ